MATYDVHTHPLLSEMARTTANVEPAAFEALVTTTEALLGLSGTTFTGPQLETARLAIVYTVNKMAALTGEEELLAEQEVGEGRRMKYRDNIDLIASASRMLVASLGIIPPSPFDTPAIDTAPFPPVYRC